MRSGFSVWTNFYTLPSSYLQGSIRIPPHRGEIRINARALLFLRCSPVPTEEKPRPQNKTPCRESIAFTPLPVILATFLSNDTVFPPRRFLSVIYHFSCESGSFLLNSALVIRSEAFWCFFFFLIGSYLPRAGGQLSLIGVLNVLVLHEKVTFPSVGLHAGSFWETLLEYGLFFSGEVLGISLAVFSLVYAAI